jgi:hypothetical protein
MPTCSAAMAKGELSFPKPCRIVQYPGFEGIIYMAV